MCVYVCVCVCIYIYIYIYIIYYTLRRAHQRYLFMNSKHHKSDALKVAIQLLVVTTKKYI